MHKEEILSELSKLINKDEFQSEILHSDEIWRSNPKVYDLIFSKMNFCTVQLLKAVESNSPKWMLKIILKDNLRSFRRIDYDTEDAEFITDCFDLLAGILDIRFGRNLMRWLYGPIVWLIVKIGRFLRPEKIIETKNRLAQNAGPGLKFI